MTSPETCNCGYDAKHPMIETHEHYSALGWVLLMCGATPVPIRIDYRCSRCEVVLTYTTDPKMLRNYHQGGRR